MLCHGGDEFVEHAAPAKQRVAASPGSVGLQTPVVAERFPCRTEQGQQDDRKGVDQLSAVTPIGNADVHRTHPCAGLPPADAGGTFANSAHAEAQVLGIAERALDAQALAI